MVRVLAYNWFFFVKQKTAYEVRISDWSSDVCSSDLVVYEITPNPPRHLGVGTAIDWERPGLTLDLIKGVGERLRINLAFERMPWKRGLLLIETGDADAIFHTSYLAGREAVGAFPKTADGRPDASRALFSQS